VDLDDAPRDGRADRVVVEALPERGERLALADLAADLGQDDLIDAAERASDPPVEPDAPRPSGVEARPRVAPIQEQALGEGVVVDLGRREDRERAARLDRRGEPRLRVLDHEVDEQEPHDDRDHRNRDHGLFLRSADLRRRRLAPL
jgi:hypothetical protein